MKYKSIIVFIYYIKHLIVFRKKRNVPQKRNVLIIDEYTAQGVVLLTL